MVQPITPAEVVDKKKESLPDEVIEAFNEMIAENWNGSEALVDQSEVVDRMVRKWRGSYETERSLRNEIFAKHYLDVEDIYKAQGWEVEYDKPGYSENYNAFFRFKRKSKSPKN